MILIFHGLRLTFCRKYACRLQKSFCLMMCESANEPNIFLKMASKAGGPSALVDMALVTFVRQ